MSNQTISLSLSHSSIPHRPALPTMQRAPEFCTGRAESGRAYEFCSSDRNPYLYIFAVGSGPKDAPAVELTTTTYNGYVVSIRNAELLPIPPLPEGWNGRDRE